RSIAEANRALAEANAHLELEKARELEVLNRNLQTSNHDLARSNHALQAQVAERNRAERALKEADRRKDEFLAILAHELRNPLAALSASARLLGMQPQNQELSSMASSAIQRQVTHMARLLDDLLDVSRISHGVMQLQRDKVELADVVRSAAEMVRPQLEAKQQTLHTVLSDRSAPVLADAVRMIQVLANLLSNSVKYTPEGGRIVMRLDVDEAGFTVSVRDNGSGIAPAMLDQVFDMFYQVSKAQGGLGIGLALVKGLVELHGGRIRAVSAGEGQGSEFLLTLPRAQEAAQLAGVAGGETGAGDAAPMRVLVADDNRDNAMSWAILIEGLGHQVAVAYDGLSAVQSASLMRPQVLLLDIGMPHLDGYEVARRIRDTDWGRDAFLVAVTGWGQAKDRAMAREAGFDEHYTKPLDPDHLEVLLRKASLKFQEACSSASVAAAR